MKKLKNTIKKIIYIIIFIYVAIILINQQKSLNSYAANCETLEEQISEKETYQKQLTEKKNNADSKEYIEEIARNKLDMYYSNERVYINKQTN